ncbi:probable receptor-like protein kinase At1g30570 isoform X2 [Tripterygium wilfordii]|uniref:probable receptor-like protein kinase At1g30570 isoform X2 n=1 Tax=Tripterygium wilfordii TaxID=458696 RepID=UPI0018F853BD|nr:probable receptor-like protein kinase At1g30570 isoform X2 [Tripterygium wilfordii]
MSGTLAAILGGAAGAVALVGIVVFFIWYCLSHKRSISRTSETGSSDPSVQLGRHVGVELSLREARRFEMEELSLATKGFSDKNLIGIGKLGEVYKGLLNDGMLVAIKKRPGAPSQAFVNEARYLAPIQHRNLVTLLGYCQENNLQFLVYEYVPNGSVSSHLYGAGQVLHEKLEFKNRLSIALGAAKDENFIAKVADAGLRNFLGRFDVAGPSSQVTADEIFLAPEVREFRRFSEKSDVYSFGVFLLELLSGREATEAPSSDSSQNLVEWVQSDQNYTNFSSVIDTRLGSFTTEGMEEFIQLILRCLEMSSERRHSMNFVVMELDRILEKEMNLTTVMGEEGTPDVILGSQLFKAK